MLIGIGLPLVALLAAFSWHFIEKRIIALRKKFSFVARVRGVVDTTTPSLAAPVTAQDLVAPAHEPKL